MSVLAVYNPEPTVERFHWDSESFVRGIMGPIGSGKSVGCVMEIWNRCRLQRPSRDGWRRSRWGVIRNTYPELRSTTIKTWQEWVPESVCGFVYSPLIVATIRYVDQDDPSIKVEAEILFVSVDKPKDIKKLLSLELTGLWINEAREIPKAVVDQAIGRTGRYPPKKEGGFNWSGAIMDTNPPDDLHWWYQAAEEELPEGWAFYRQPGALRKVGNVYHENPAAENVQNHTLGYAYWLRQLANKTDNWIRVYILGEYGSIEAGKPIYAGQWSDALHVAEEPIKPIPGLPLLCGWDFGLTPAVAICQITPRGRLNVLDEIVGEDVGVRQFADNFVLPHLAAHYAGHHIEHIGDPSGKNRGEANEASARKELKLAGIRLRLGPTNDVVQRLEAVRYFLTTLNDGKPVMRVDKRCKMLRKGFNGAYKYRQLQVAGSTERYADKPDKDVFSHIHDALQYACTHLRRDYIMGQKEGQATRRRAPTAAGWT